MLTDVWASVTAIATVVTTVNYIIFRIYNGKVSTILERFDDLSNNISELDRKLDKLTKEYEGRISRLEGIINSMRK